MPSLAQLLAHHESILVLDAASARVQTGLLRAGRPALWRASCEEAGKAIFKDTASLLAEAGRSLDDVAAFAYCSGPGSMLGVRSAAMALRTWLTLRPRSVYVFHSLAVAARAEWRRQPRALKVIADARRDTWHCQTVAPDGTLPPLARVPAAALSEGELLTPEHFRAWAVPPRAAATCGYDLAGILPDLATDDLLAESPAPDAFQHEAPEYQKWSARIHSAETAPRP